MHIYTTQCLKSQQCDKVFTFVQETSNIPHKLLLVYWTNVNNLSHIWNLSHCVVSMYILFLWKHLSTMRFDLRTPRSPVSRVTDELWSLLLGIYVNSVWNLCKFINYQCGNITSFLIKRTNFFSQLGFNHCVV